MTDAEKVVKAPAYGVRRIMGCSAEDTFWRSIVVVENCWEWIGSTNRHGYGTLRKKLAHRWAYEHLRGPIPSGLDIDHLCRNRRCVNPEHMEPVTRRENTVRGFAHKPFIVERSHCRRGHPLSGDNLGVTPNGQRRCKTCHAARAKARKERLAPR